MARPCSVDCRLVAFVSGVRIYDDQTNWRNLDAVIAAFKKLRHQQRHQVVIRIFAYWAGSVRRIADTSGWRAAALHDGSVPWTGPLSFSGRGASGHERDDALPPPHHSMSGGCTVPACFTRACARASCFRSHRAKAPRPARRGRRHASDPIRGFATTRP